MKSASLPYMLQLSQSVRPVPYEFCTHDRNRENEIDAESQPQVIGHFTRGTDRRRNFRDNITSCALQ